MAKCRQAFSSVCVRDQNELQNSKGSNWNSTGSDLTNTAFPPWSINWLTSIRQGLNSAENKDKLLCKLMLKNFPAPLHQWPSSLHLLIMLVFAVVKLLSSMEISTLIPWSNLLLFYFYLENKTQTDFKYATQVIDPASGLYGASLQSCNFCPPQQMHNGIKKEKKKGSPCKKSLHTTV